MNYSKEVLASIIIPVYNQPRYTKQCLQAVLANSGCEFPWEVIVVDNASRIEVRSLFPEPGLPHLKIIKNSNNNGFIRACNQAATMARGKYLVFLNNDTIPQPGWLQALVNFAEQNPRIGAVGGKLLFPDGRLQEAGAIIWQDGSGYNYGRGDCPGLSKYNFPRLVDYCSGACLLVRALLFHALGGFDLRYDPMYYEDVDFCFALRKAGYLVIYNPVAEVIHLEGGTAGRDVSKGFKKYQEINRAKFIAKWETELKHQFPPELGNIERACCRLDQAVL